jgi:hypothetical protein
MRRMKINNFAGKPAPATASMRVFRAPLMSFKEHLRHAGREMKVRLE